MMKTDHIDPVNVNFGPTPSVRPFVSTVYIHKTGYRNRFQSRLSIEVDGRYVCSFGSPIEVKVGVRLRLIYSVTFSLGRFT